MGFLLMVLMSLQTLEQINKHITWTTVMLLYDLSQNFRHMSGTEQFQLL